MAEITKLTADRKTLHLDFETPMEGSRVNFVRSVLLEIKDDGFVIDLSGLFGQKVITKQTDDQIKVTFK